MTILGNLSQKKKRADGQNVAQRDTSGYNTVLICTQRTNDIGVGRFRILGGGARFKILGAKRGQIPSRHMTS